MADKITIKLIGDEQRARAQGFLSRAPLGYVVTISEPSRTLDQNALMWAALADIAKAKPDGREMTPENWKGVFMDAADFKPKFEPNLEGDGFVCLGYKSSRLSKAEFSDLIETIFEYGARKGVRWSNPIPTEYEAQHG